MYCTITWCLRIVYENYERNNTIKLLEHQILKWTACNTKRLNANEVVDMNNH